MDRQTFAQNILGHRERLWGYALKLTRDRAEAEDLLQLTYLRAFERWEQLRQPESACSWLIRMMHRAFVDRYRRRARTPVESLNEASPEQAAQLPRVRGPGEQTEARDALRKTLEQLAPPLAQALTLRDVWGFSYEEIAALMECPIGTVRSRIARARMQMLQLLEQETGEDREASGARQRQGESS